MLPLTGSASNVNLPFLKNKLILSDQLIIDQTTQWIKSVVVGCNFCPFAAPVLKSNSIRYIVGQYSTSRQMLDHLLKEMRLLDTHADIETTFVIYPVGLGQFRDYLNFVQKAEQLNSAKGYDGVYQLATFHPEYCFAGSVKDDPANFTNRSIYPMLHLLREDSVTKALAHFPDPDSIPQKNIDYARNKGLQYMQWLRGSCM
jgi:hypothetical protein